MRNYEDLEVWQKSHALTLQLYRLTETFPRSEIFGLTAQLRRAAASIGANLAEGCGRWSELELARYVQIAMGSASELQNHLRLARDLQFLKEEDYRSSLNALTSIRQMLTALLQTLRRTRSQSKSASASGEQRKANSE